MNTVHFNVGKSSNEALCGAEDGEFTDAHWSASCPDCSAILADLEASGVDLDNLEDE